MQNGFYQEQDVYVSIHKFYLPEKVEAENKKNIPRWSGKKNNVEVPAARLFMCAHIVFLFFLSAFLLSFFHSISARQSGS